MGWDYNLLVDFSPREIPIERFAQLVSEITLKSGFEGIDRICVFSYELYELQRHELEQSVIAQIENLHGLPSLNSWLENARRSFAGEDYYFKCVWDVIRNTVENETVVTYPYFVELTIFGHAWKKHMTGTFRDSTGIVYGAGNSLIFYTLVKTAATTKNLEMIINEVGLLVDSGAQFICGLDKEDSDKPWNWSLIYCDQPSKFLNNVPLSSADEKARNRINRDVIISAVLDCEDVAVREIGQGLVVYNQHGTAGNLTIFYKSLLKLLQNQPSGEN